MDNFHISDFGIREAFEIVGWPVMTIMRGQVAVEDGQLTAPAGRGQWIPRKVDREISSRPIG